MTQTQLSLGVSSVLFVAMLLCLEIGFRMGRRSAQKHPELTHEGIGAIDAAVFALLGLLLGFSFAGATSRLDSKREQIVNEANAIGTAYLRLDLLSASEQPEMRRLFRDYLDARLRAYEKLSDRAASEQELANADKLQQKIWSRAIAAGQADSSHDATRLLLPAINDMIDVTASRTIALHSRLPRLIFCLLILVALLSALLAGYAMAQRPKRSGLHVFVYAMAVSLTVYAVLDLDSPRSGLIRLDAADNALFKLRDAIQPVR